MKYIINGMMAVVVSIGLVFVYLAMCDVVHADTICYMVDNLMVCNYY